MSKPSEPLRIKVSANLREYLAYLADTTTFGRDENDVALTLLSIRLEEMRHSPQYAYKFKSERRES